jgi:serine/threonine-protein kinase
VTGGATPARGKTGFFGQSPLAAAQAQGRKTGMFPPAGAGPLPVPMIRRVGLTAPTPIIPGYVLGWMLTEGACGEIYVGEEFAHRQKVAVKILHPRNEHNSLERRHLRDEGRIGLRLKQHPNVVRTLRVGKTGRRPYIVMELILGESLRELLRDGFRAGNRELHKLAVALAKALQHIHGHGVVHKDVKPDNIMYDRKDGIVLLDFGFAETRWMAFLHSFRPRLDGSPAYLAPELIRTKRASPATDLYALGCTLYEAARGEPPFMGLNHQLTMALQTDLERRPEPLGQFRKDLSTPMERLIMQLLAKDHGKRFQTAEQVLLELARMSPG